MQVVIEESLAGGGLDQGLAVVAIGGDATLNIGLEAFKLLVGDEVHHAADGVGAIGGRGAAGDHVHAVDQQLGKFTDVGDAGDVGAHHALAVQQGKGADGA